ncbi:MAG: hypothetical protein E7191_01655 [Erysipelotrichaceae bacterium]|nr:hypothetical protein [Erysipelotrichaceae bacterium]
MSESCKDTKKLIKFGPVLFLILFIGFFYLFASKMGVGNMLNTMMQTAYSLLMDTCFYLMAISVLAGAVASLFSEFGVVDLINQLLSPLMKPLYGMPGAAALGVVTTYLSDNPAIISLAKNKKFIKCFKEYQVPALTNLGTSFGMGLVVTIFVLSQASICGEDVIFSAICGTLGAVVGSIVSTRIMLYFTKKDVGSEMLAIDDIVSEEEKEEKEPKLSLFLRLLNCLTTGGKTGVELGLDIIPGVLIICTIVMMFTYGPSLEGYTGAAYEGIALLPTIANKFQNVISFVFGFQSGECVSVPITAIGSAGAAMSMIPNLLKEGYATCQDLAVFNAICMCWSGYLSTHVAMMTSLNRTKYTGKAILSHTFGGLVAGFSARWIYVALSAIL